MLGTKSQGNYHALQGAFLELSIHIQLERWLQKEADPNSKLSSAHKRTIEAAFLLLSLLRELSKGAFFSTFFSLMSKGLAEKERTKNRWSKNYAFEVLEKKLKVKFVFII